MAKPKPTQTDAQRTKNFNSKLALVLQDDNRSTLSQATLSFEEFCFKCLPEKFTLAASVHHKMLFKMLPELLYNPESRAAPIAIAAARDSAKTTMTCAFMTWAGLEGLIKFALLIGASHKKACEFLSLIKNDILESPCIQEFYPNSCKKGSIWNREEIELSNGFTIRANGCGAKGIRGAQSRFGRPDLVICDDIENDEQVRSAEQRDKVGQWIDNTVLNLGAGDRRAIVLMIGTTLRQDSVLLRKIENPYWKSFVLKAILEWPDNFNLWEDWHEMRCNFGSESANAFYKKNEPALLQGAEVAWPERYSLKHLMEKYFSAPITFQSEFQQRPISEANLFNDSIFYWEAEKDLPENGFYLGAVDPALGNDSRRADYSAIIIGYCVPKQTRIYVVNAFLSRAPSSEIASQIIQFQRQYKCTSWVVESHSWQSLFRQHLVERAATAQVPLPVYPIKPENTKDSRIKSLHPFFFNQNILLHRTQKMLIQQLKNYPFDAHDDGPDALEMLWRHFSKSLGRSDVVMTFKRRALPNQYLMYHHNLPTSRRF